MAHKDKEKRRAYNVAYRRANRERLLAYDRQRKRPYVPRPKARVQKYNRKAHEKIRQAIWDAKAKPCADCGVQYPPWVMDFDHRDQSEKHERMRVVNGKRKTQTIWGLPLEDRLKEIAKCDVVCANCHRQRTYIKKQTAWRRETVASAEEAPEPAQGRLPF